MQTLLKVVLLVYRCTCRSESFDILEMLLNLKILLIDKTTAAILLQREESIRERLKLSPFKPTAAPLVFRFLFSVRFTIKSKIYFLFVLNSVYISLHMQNAKFYQVLSTQRKENATARCL